MTPLKGKLSHPKLYVVSRLRKLFEHNNNKVKLILHIYNQKVEILKYYLHFRFSLFSIYVMFEAYIAMLPVDITAVITFTSVCIYH